MSNDHMTSAPARRFEGTTAIVTGASRGIGLAIAQRLVAEGARVCITARHRDALDEVAAGLPPGQVLAVAGRADDPAHRAEVLDAVATTFGRLDVLVNNAGINPAYGPLLELDPEAAQKILDVNVLGTLAWCRAVVTDERLGFGAHGSIVNIASFTGLTPSEGIGMYGISKAAVIHLTRTLAVELGPAVRVNAVAPAVVRTRFARALYEDREEAVSAAYPMKRLGEPEDIAAAVAYLASPEASWVTGEVLTVDGGLLSAGGTA